MLILAVVVTIVGPFVIGSWAYVWALGLFGVAALEAHERRVVRRQAARRRMAVARVRRSIDRWERP